MGPCVLTGSMLYVGCKMIYRFALIEGDWDFMLEGFDMRLNSFSTFLICAGSKVYDDDYRYYGISLKEAS